MAREKDQPLPANMPPMDPRMLAAMYNMQEEDGIDLLEYWRTIWKRRWLILAVVVVAGGISIAYALTLPNIYRADAIIVPVGGDGNKGVSLGGFGGLASMAGISLGGGGNVEENLAVLKSRGFLWRFVKDNKLKPLLFADNWDSARGVWRGKEPSQWATYRKINNMVSAFSNKSGLITIAIEWTDADLAAQWANALVARLNEHLRQQALDQSKQTLGYLKDELGKVRVAEMRQALFELISQEQGKAMLASTQKEFAFKVLDAAVAPDLKFKPKRSKIVILTMIISGFFAMLAVFLWEGLKTQKLNK